MKDLQKLDMSQALGDWTKKVENNLKNKTYKKPEDIEVEDKGILFKWKPYMNEGEYCLFGVTLVTHVAINCNFLCDYLEIAYKENRLAFKKLAEDVIFMYQEWLNRLTIPQIDGRYNISSIEHYLLSPLMKERLGK